MKNILLTILIIASPLSIADIKPEDRQYHWELNTDYWAYVYEVYRLIGFCTNNDDDIDDFLRNNFSRFSISFDSVVRSYESHNYLWKEGILSVFDTDFDKNDLINRVILDKGLSESDLCDKLLWLKIGALEEIVIAMNEELGKHKSAYVNPIGLSRIWKNKEDNPWYESVDVPYMNLQKLFNGNPFKN